MVLEHLDTGDKKLNLNLSLTNDKKINSKCKCKVKSKLNVKLYNFQKNIGEKSLWEQWPKVSEFTQFDPYKKTEING